MESYDLGMGNGRTILMISPVQVPSGMGSVGGSRRPAEVPVRLMPLHAVGRRVPRNINKSGNVSSGWVDSILLPMPSRRGADRRSASPTPNSSESKRVDALAGTNTSGSYATLLTIDPVRLLSVIPASLSPNPSQPRRRPALHTAAGSLKQ